MANSKLIIVEGPQGSGKTTITDYLRNRLPYTNLYRLCGTSDTGKTGKNKAVGMYLSLLDYIKTLENKNINLLFDRTFFTEEVYCRLNKKDYDFTDIYEDLCDKLFNMDFDIYYISLYLFNPDMYKVRLARDGKAEFKNSKFSAENSYNQQCEYDKMIEELYGKYKDKAKFLRIDMDEPLESIFLRINDIFNID